ncbi:MAG: serine hydrolase domain-containing protein [Prolixibacteraceae bacterium]
MRARRVSIAVILVLFLGVYLYMNPLLPIITGYASKNLASGVFVAGRSQQSLENNDLNFSFIKFVKNKVNYETGEVKSSFLWYTSRSVFIENFGCTLVNDATTDEIRSRPYSAVAIVPENPDTINWPMGDLLADTIPHEINPQKLEEALHLAFVDTIPYKGTFAVNVVYKGQLIAEKYRDDFKSNTKFLSWSMAKSFTNALTGILVKTGQLTIDQPVAINEWLGDERKNINLNSLMHMNSGLEWNEDYGNNSDVNIMLHKIGDMGQYTLEKSFQDPMDTKWVYSSGSTNIVSKIIRQTINNDQAYYELPRKELFNKIGMRSAVWEVDASGTFVGSSYIYATMRDYARFGLLYLNNGNWLGEQILPENWVEWSRSEAVGSDGQYGAFFWLNLEGTDYPDVPLDMFCCRGHDGQYIYIIPSKDLVVVRTGFSKKGEFDYNEFLAGIVNSIEE